MALDGALELAGPALADSAQLGHLGAPLSGLLRGGAVQLTAWQRCSNRTQRRPGRSAVQSGTNGSYGHCR